MEDPRLKKKFHVGDLVKWVDYVDGITMRKEKLGVVTEIDNWDAWVWYTITVITPHGEKIRLFPQHKQIEVINGSGRFCKSSIKNNGHD